MLQEAIDKIRPILEELWMNGDQRSLQEFARLVLIGHDKISEDMTDEQIDFRFGRPLRQLRKAAYERAITLPIFMDRLENLKEV